MQIDPKLDQRWEKRKQVVHGPGDRIDPSEYGTEIIGDKRAKAFVCQHHYAASYPAAHCTVGLFRKTGVDPARLVGVAVFSEGIQSGQAMPKYTGYGRESGTELGRLVLLPEVKWNGESWFLRRAFTALSAEKPHVRACISYADPVERLTAAGEMVKPGHFGTIYQASNAAFAGRSGARTIELMPDGRVIQPYNFHKFLHRRKGWAGAERAIAEAGVTAGCRPRAVGESDVAWVDRVRKSLRPVRHLGNLVYVFGLDSEAWGQVRKLHPKRPYPKKGDLGIEHLPHAA